MASTLCSIRYVSSLDGSTVAFMNGAAFFQGNPFDADSDKGLSGWLAYREYVTSAYGVGVSVKGNTSITELRWMPRIYFSSGTCILIPWWTLSLPLFLTSILMRRRPSKLTECRMCRYDLKLNISGVCPECGTPIPDEQRKAIAEAAKVELGGGNARQPGGGADVRSEPPQ